MRYIGDVHGKYDIYSNTIINCKKSIQIGDFGFKYEHDWFLKNINCKEHKILFGNHDYYPYIEKDHSLGRYKVDILNKQLFISGAYSIDRVYRTEGLNWFNDEELTMKQFYDLYDLCKNNTFDIIVSHDCPQIIRQDVFGIKERSLTSMGLQMIYDEFKPYIWIFGHHHKSIKHTNDTTEFICLEENEFIDI